jgi:maleate cis-trans isomerase
MSIEEGIDLALEVGREAGQSHPGREAVLIPGGAALSLYTVPLLEQELAVPVLTNMNAEVWNNLVRTGVIAPVTGWGRLLERR